VVVVLLAGIGSIGEARSLRDTLAGASATVGLQGGSAFDALADVLADTAARNLPVVSASAGYTYRFNPELEVFERASDTLGPIFLERPDTIGRRRVNLNVSFQYVQFDTIDGDDLDRLTDPAPIVTQVVDAAGNLLGFTANDLEYRLGLQNYITAFSATYGILDNLDANLLLPLIQTTFRVGVATQQRFIAGPDGAFVPQNGPRIVGRTRDDAFGVGDILLRLKCQLPRRGGLHSAAGLQLRLPSGDDENFQGTGAFELSPAMHASMVAWRRATFYANAAIDLRAADVEQSQARYGIGGDVDLTRRVGLVLAFLGRSEFTGSADPEDTAFLHLAGGAAVPRPLLGVEFEQNNFFDFSFGTRIVVWRDVMLFLNGIYALNDAGLRNGTIIPTVGLEGTF
jgi:hypothetical protein